MQRHRAQERKVSALWCSEQTKILSILMWSSYESQSVNWQTVLFRGPHQDVHNPHLPEALRGWPASQMQIAALCSPVATGSGLRDIRQNTLGITQNTTASRIMLRRDGGAAQSAEEAAFDRARRELVFELRGAPADRTRTAEELAELERQRLEVRALRYPMIPHCHRGRFAGQLRVHSCRVWTAQV